MGDNPDGTKVLLLGLAGCGVSGGVGGGEVGVGGGVCVGGGDPLF